MSDDLDKRFQDAAEKIKVWKPKKDPSDDEKLQIYALYKQATQGDNTGSRPGMFDFTGRRKFDAWLSKKGMSAEEAKEKYIAEVERQITTYGTKE